MKVKTGDFTIFQFSVIVIIQILGTTLAFFLLRGFFNLDYPFLFMMYIITTILLFIEVNRGWL